MVNRHDHTIAIHTNYFSELVAMHYGIALFANDIILACTYARVGSIFSDLQLSQYEQVLDSHLCHLLHLIY